MRGHDGDVTVAVVKCFRVGVALLVCGVSVSACQSQADDGDAIAFFDRRAEVICRKNFECCMGDDILSASEQSCVASNNINNYAERARSSIRRGHAKLDETAADACLAAVSRLSCSEWAAVIRGADPAPCSRVLVGNLGTGSACTEDYDCASAFCDKPAQAAQGACAPKGAAGAPCAPETSGCVDGFSCLKGASDANVCTARKLAGESCSRGIECASAHCKSDTCRPECWGEVLSHELFGN